jgi:hypothetical protein
MRMQDNLVVARQTDVKNLGLRMIDPDDGVEVGRHGFVPPGLRSVDRGSILHQMRGHERFELEGTSYRIGVSVD